jgi:hypothetical protein
MRNWIAGAIAVLGTLLVLGGAATVLSRTWFNRPAPDETATTAPAYGAAQDRSRWLSRLSPPDRLIVWGIVLLALAALVTGAIGFSLGANAPAK